MEYRWQEINFNFLFEKALYQPQTQTLVIADLHLGKATHFRKHGISIPPASAEKDYECLNNLINKFDPKRVILLGDLFHSSHNSEWLMFHAFVNACEGTTFILIRGNHDIMPTALYENSHIVVYEKAMEENNIVFSHIPLKNIPENKINITGHIHPGVVLRGKGRQLLQLPCFYLFKNQLILPAFGNLTGLQMITPEKESEVFIIAEKNVIRI